MEISSAEIVVMSMLIPKQPPQVRWYSAEDYLGSNKISNIYHFVLALLNGIGYTLHSESEVFTFSEIKMKRLFDENWRVKTQWFSDSPEYHYFKTEKEARDFIKTVAEPKHLWWVLEVRQ